MLDTENTLYEICNWIQKRINANEKIRINPDIELSNKISKGARISAFIEVLNYIQTRKIYVTENKVLLNLERKIKTLKEVKELIFIEKDKSVLKDLIKNEIELKAQIDILWHLLKNE